MADNAPSNEIEKQRLLLAKLESALIEYVERFGPSERAHEALRLMSLWHAGNSSTGVRERPNPE